MLTLTLIGTEYFDEETSTFSTVGDIVLQLEHSLVSLSKWESIHEKPFLTDTKKTLEETKSYIECMILTPNLPEDFLDRLTVQDYDKINAYIESKQSATTFGKMPEVRGRRGETVTSELIYYWLVAFNIPFEAETWHLNRLLSLVRICNIKSGKQKKMSRSEIAARNRELNEQRRAQLGTKG